MNKKGKKNNYKNHQVIHYIYLIVGIIIVALAFNLFLLPNHIVFGGLSGLSILINKELGTDPALFIFICAIFLLLISSIFLGVDKTKNALLGSILIPIAIKLSSGIGLYFEISFNDQLLIALFGGVLSGLGYGLIFKSGFSSGGTEIINQIVHKYLKISIGTSMLFVDGIIVLAGGFIFGWTIFMYSIVVLYIISILTDKVLLGISDSKAFYIITSKPDEVSNYVIKELNHSITEFSAKGAFKNKKNAVLFAVIPTKEYFKFKEGIEEIDSDVFITVVDAYEVMGEH